MYVLIVRIAVSLIAHKAIMAEPTERRFIAVPIAGNGLKSQIPESDKTIPLPGIRD